MRATLAIVDVTGRRIATLTDGALDAGWHQVEWPSSGNGPVRPGLYWAVLEADGRRLVRRVVLIDR
jgi:hypothetical protein